MDLFVSDLQKDDSLQGIEHQFNNLLESSLSDNEKLQIYYLMRDRLVIHRDSGSNDAILLMTLMMNNPEVQEFMFRIADEETEAQVQQVKSLTLFNKPSMIKRKTVPPQEVQTLKQEERKVQEEEPKQIVEIPKQNIIILQDEEPEFDKLLRQAKQTMNETQLDEAYKFATEALKFKGSANYKENQDFLEEIVQKYDYMIMNLKEMETDGWIPDAEKSGIKVKYKFVAGTSTASMIMETEVPVNAVRVLSLVNEADLNHLWVPFCMRTYVNKVINRACKVCTTEMYFPLIPNRETVFVGEGIDRLNVNGTIVLMSRSIQDDKQFQQRYDLNIPAKSKFVRMLIRYYLFEIKPLSHDRCQIRAITNCDPFIHMVPNSVIAYIGRKFAHILIGKIVHYAKNFETSPFYPVFQEHREFYTWIEDKMNKYLQK